MKKCVETLPDLCLWYDVQGLEQKHVEPVVSRMQKFLEEGFTMAMQGSPIVLKQAQGVRIPMSQDPTGFEAKSEPFYYLGSL